jgi:hypothetical protein
MALGPNDSTYGLYLGAARFESRVVTDYPYTGDKIYSVHKSVSYFKN